MLKRKLKILSNSEKLTIIREFESGKTREELCLKFDVPKSTLYRIIQNKDKIDSNCYEGQGKLKRARLSEYPELEKRAVSWMKQNLAKDVPIGGPLIKQKAQEIAADLKICEFNASNGWLEGFKRRNDLVFRKKCGESKAVDDITCNQWIEDFPNLLLNYSADDIFNADETGLFFKCLPNKTFTFKGEPCHGVN